MSHISTVLQAHALWHEAARLSLRNCSVKSYLIKVRLDAFGQQIQCVSIFSLCILLYIGSWICHTFLLFFMYSNIMWIGFCSVGGETSIFFFLMSLSLIHMTEFLNNLDLQTKQEDTQDTEALSRSISLLITDNTQKCANSEATSPCTTVDRAANKGWRKPQKLNFWWWACNENMAGYGPWKTFVE